MILPKELNFDDQPAALKWLTNEGIFNPLTGQTKEALDPEVGDRIVVCSICHSIAPQSEHGHSFYNPSEDLFICENCEDTEGSN